MNNYSTKNSNKRGLKKLQSLGRTPYQYTKLPQSESCAGQSNSTKMTAKIPINTYYLLNVYSSHIHVLYCKYIHVGI